jgi:glycosyltransferase involved in cell wall biosynthesis
MSRPSYVLISPVRDEEHYVELTLEAVIRQTESPARWVIVDDGSRDGTVDIVRRYAARYPFIRLLHHPSTGARAPGAAVVRAFDYGCMALEGLRYDFIVKLDCDLSFDRCYFEELLRRFAIDARLGIASGIYLESGGDGEWRPVPMPSYHAFGACKVVRRECFEDIGGFAAAAGWDTVDEIRAWQRGWITCHFEELQARHHKREGSGVGPLRTSRMHGEIYYTTGGDPLFLPFKILRRAMAKPRLVCAGALMCGYFGALLKGSPRLVTDGEAKLYRRVLRRRSWARALQLIRSRR